LAYLGGDAVIDMELLSVIRRWHYRDHFSIREISRRTGLSRNTVRKYLRSGSEEPKFSIPDRPSKLDPYADKLSHMLRQEEEAESSSQEERRLREGVNRRRELTPPQFIISMFYRADRRRDPAPNDFLPALATYDSDRGATRGLEGGTDGFRRPRSGVETFTSRQQRRKGGPARCAL
jgi:transcriptional regulator with XRE-family HTH domain